MKNSIKFLSLCFFALGMAVFTSCGSDDETMDVDVTVCDSLTAQINVTYDSLETIIEVETFGFAGPFTYVWSNGETTNPITVAANDMGTYSVTVTADAVEGCEVSGTVDLQNPVDCSTFSSSISMSTDTSGNDTEIFLLAEVTGGTAPYVYVWTTGDTNPSIEVTEEGVYSVVINDANGCVTNASFTVEEVGGVDCTNFSATLTQSDSFTVVLLFADPTGGTAPYTYEWSTGQVTTSEFIGSLEVVVSGTYTVTITDANGCVTVGTYTVVVSDPCANFYVSIFLNADSLGMGDDYLFGYANGGTNPYSYLWSNGETGTTIDVTGGSGTYEVTVVDSNGCAVTDSYEL